MLQTPSILQPMPTIETGAPKTVFNAEQTLPDAMVKSDRGKKMAIFAGIFLAVSLYILYGMRKYKIPNN